MLQNLLQYQFAPVALGLLALQGTGQIGRFVAQTLVQLLQPLQLSGQGKALAGLVLIAFFDALLEGLDALFQRLEQLSQPLMGGLAEALLTLVEDPAGELGELRAQFVARGLKVGEALLMRVVLLAQFGVQRGMGGAQPT